MTDGIYTVANDFVYNQLVALLNSIEVNVGKEIPVCVIAYDDRLDLVRPEIAKRENVTLLEDPALFKPWEDFSYRLWKTHPSAFKIWQEKGIEGVYRIGMNRRYYAFDSEAPFEKFAYFDADVLVLNTLELVFKSLNEHDFVVYDFQYKDPTHIYNVKNPKLLEVFTQNRIEAEIFCAGFYAGKRGLFTLEKLDYIVSSLERGEAEILYMPAPNQSALNYMIMRSNIPVCNLALQLPKSQTTGCSVTSTHFELQDNVLYDRGNRLTYLHYIGISSNLFNRLCAGENIECPYRDIFLHYRYLHEPEKRPKFTTKAKPFEPDPNLATRVLRKLGLKK
ncbi:Npun_R2821/Npun_R2822 family protein [Argonema antarcticum]|uniref:Npun_R2821/Npun_R2822 family protein n=1 Tax=Argonema antarcticum TaxID=2942763 RepID=UPI002011F6EA|nr:Npun_R2821/Npun_R2822 family protein [Argonema antarcticum]MCL1472592.1 sugar transferase [Argonema antarcticum A004/B2]